jgi:hypothetical protein
MMHDIRSTGDSAAENGAQDGVGSGTDWATERAIEWGHSTCLLFDAVVATSV